MIRNLIAVIFALSLSACSAFSANADICQDNATWVARLVALGDAYNNIKNGPNAQAEWKLIDPRLHISEIVMERQPYGGDTAYVCSMKVEERFSDIVSLSKDELAQGIVDQQSFQLAMKLNQQLFAMASIQIPGLLPAIQTNNQPIIQEATRRMTFAYQTRFSIRPESDGRHYYANILDKQQSIFLSPEPTGEH